MMCPMQQGFVLASAQGGYCLVIETMCTLGVRVIDGEYGSDDEEYSLDVDRGSRKEYREEAE